MPEATMTDERLTGNVSSGDTIRFVHHPDFDNPEAVHNILESLSESPTAESEATGFISSDDYHLPDPPLLSADDERTLFLRMNLLRCLAARRQRDLQQPGKQHSSHATVQHLLEQADAVRNEIVTANQRLAVSVAGSFVQPGVYRAEVIGEANIALIKSVNLFDVSRGYRLSTYATHAMRRHLIRYVQRELKRSTVNVEELSDPLFEDEHPDWLDIHPNQLINEILSELPGREQDMVRQRFGLTSDGRAQTLEEIATRFHISKERVRQLVTRACARAELKHSARLGYSVRR